MATIRLSFWNFPCAQTCWSVRVLACARRHRTQSDRHHTRVMQKGENKKWRIRQDLEVFDDRKDEVLLGLEAPRKEREDPDEGSEDTVATLQYCVEHCAVFPELRELDQIDLRSTVWSRW